MARTYLYPFYRFASVDPARDGWNPYAYVANRPISYFDPTGTELVLAADKKTQRKLRPILAQMLRRPSGRASLASLDESSVIFNLKAGKLNPDRAVLEARTKSGAHRIRFGETMNPKRHQGKLVSVDIVIDVNALVVSPVDQTGVATMAHEASHANAIVEALGAGKSFIEAWAAATAGDLPDSENGPAAQVGRAIYQEDTDLTLESAEQVLQSLLETGDKP